MTENEIRTPLSDTERKILRKAAGKFACHSDYHGDMIVSILICMSEGKEVGKAEPCDEWRRMETAENVITKIVKRLKKEMKPNLIGNSFCVLYEKKLEQIAKEIMEDYK
jgi:ubiquitin-protein ligase